MTAAGAGRRAISRRVCDGKPRDIRQTKHHLAVPSAFPFLAAGLRLYFNRALPMYLLYRFERIQFDAWHKLTHSAAYESAAAAGTSPQPDDYASVYGPEHLLRMFVKLPELLAHIPLTDDEAKVLQTTVNDFLK